MATSLKRMGRPGLDRGTRLPPVRKIIAFLIITIVAAAAGAIFGLQVEALVARTLEQAREGGEVEPAAVEPALGQAAAIRILPPVVTRLAGPQPAWVRIEASIILSGEPSPEDDVLAAKIAEDVVAFMQTVSAADIEGASGFQHLREDLNDRVRVRSNGRAREVVIHTFIVE